MISSFKMVAINAMAALVICTLIPLSVSADPKVGVIIPELRAPFNIIFEKIGDGVDERLRKRAPKLRLEKNYDSGEVARWIKKEKINAIVSLGNLGQEAVLQIPENIPVVLGALSSSPAPPNKYPGIALTPNPRTLFDLLKRLDNRSNKIIVVYNPDNNQWLVDLAKQQAVDSGIQLYAYQAANIKQSAILFSEIFDGASLENTAIWLLPDRKVVDSKVVMPFILEKAWQKKVIVFSSAISHVKKGVLFSLYPNNESHGKELTELILSEVTGFSSAGNKLFPTMGLQNAINSRTAEHLGLTISRSEIKEFDVVFPLSN
tara:strand:+ start:18013 stop:18966 length:954 start_codon:yes stop_codon:yes gene_type:complete